MVVSHHPLPSILPMLLLFSSSSPGIPAQRPPSPETSDQGGAGRSYIFAHALSEGSTVFKSWRGKVAVAAAAGGGGGGCGNFFAELADHAVRVLPLEQETCLIMSKNMSVAVPTWR